MDVGQPKPATKDQEQCAAGCAPTEGGNGCQCGDDCGCAQGACGDAPEAVDPDYDPEDESWRGDHAPVVDEPAPEVIDELSTACIRFVKDAIGVELDFAAETLPLLDHYLNVAKDELAEKLELRELVWRAAGAYFGEVLRRRINGYWQLPSEDVHGWRVCGRHVLMSINPVGVIAEAIDGNTEGDGPSGAIRLARASQETVAHRLAEMPPLPENEFYLTSTRLELLDIVVEHLHAILELNNQQGIEFDLDDYLNDLKAYGQA